MTSPVRISYLYVAKLFTASVMVCLTMIWIGVLFIVSGWLAGISVSIPFELVSWLFRGAIAGTVICAIQLSLSLIIRSFAVPVGIALIGGFSGVAILAQGLGAYYPYSLLALGMNASNPEGAMPVSLITFIVHCLLFILACWLFTSLWIKKRDVVAG
jgi:ABC-2 type transport system permease protein